MIFFPKIVLDLAIIIHGYQGLLAFAVLFLWHLYNVHLHPSVFPMNPSWITGKVSAEWLREEHPLEYEKLKEEGLLMRKFALTAVLVFSGGRSSPGSRGTPPPRSRWRSAPCATGSPSSGSCWWTDGSGTSSSPGTRWRGRCTGRRCARTAIST